ncbi:MAG: hypothetical protein IKM25_01320 [Clostridia bacterium]|nr:hypothetical protein [Clostridia bacterium]
MKSFYSFVSNGEYGIGCTGQSVCVFDKNGEELVAFKDLKYAYSCAISPKDDIFVVKSTEGRVAVYSLADLRLIKKFRFSSVAESQDDNFCFSSDGEIFYNIERHGDSCKTALSIYSTRDFVLNKRLFLADTNMVLTSVEVDCTSGDVYMTGFYRKEKSGVAHKWFVAKLVDDVLRDFCYILDSEHEYYVDYKKLEMSGFAEKSVKWSLFKDKQTELMEAKEKKISIAELWRKRSV